MKNATILHQQAIEILLKLWNKYAKIKKSHFNWLLNNSTYHQISARGVTTLDFDYSYEENLKIQIKKSLAINGNQNLVCYFLIISNLKTILNIILELIT